MKRENDEITSLFRNRLEGAGLQVRDNFWEDLQQEIPKATRRHRLAIVRFSAAASVLMLLAGASAAFWYFSPKDEIATAFSQMAIVEPPKGKVTNDNVVNELPPVNTVTVARASSSRPRPVKAATYISEEEEDSLSVSFSMSFSFSSSERYNNHSNNDRSHNSYAGGSGRADTRSSDTPAPMIASTPKSRSWAMKLYGSGNVPASKEQQKGAMRMFSAKDNALNVNNSSGTVSRSDFPSEEDFRNYQKVLANLPAADQNTSVKHKLPFSIGLGVRKELSDRFALESGVVYSQLNSELTAGDEGNYYFQDQTLHYIGIPVKADYTLYNSKHFSLYAAAGGMVEKCVSGHVKTDYYEDGDKTYSSKHSLKADPLQVSLTASLGLQYKLNERFALYAEPGIAYYFDDGSPVATIRKEKPINLNLLCGVRVSY